MLSLLEALTVGYTVSVGVIMLMICRLVIKRQAVGELTALPISAGGSSELAPVTQYDFLVFTDSIGKHMLPHQVSSLTKKCLIKAVPGLTFGDEAWEMFRCFSSHRFQKIIIHLGTNNITKPQSCSFRVTVHEFLKKIKQQHPTACIILSNILPRGNLMPFQENLLLEYNFVLAGLAEDMEVWCKNSYSLFMNNGNPVFDPWFNKQKLHLSSHGVVKLARSFQRVLLGQME